MQFALTPQTVRRIKESDSYYVLTGFDTARNESWALIRNSQATTGIPAISEGGLLLLSAILVVTAFSVLHHRDWES